MLILHLLVVCFFCFIMLTGGSDSLNRAWAAVCYSGEPISSPLKRYCIFSSFASFVRIGSASRCTSFTAPSDPQIHIGELKNLTSTHHQVPNEHANACYTSFCRKITYTDAYRSLIHSSCIYSTDIPTWRGYHLSNIPLAVHS